MLRQPRAPGPPNAHTRPRGFASVEAAPGHGFCEGPGSGVAGAFGGTGVRDDRRYFAFAVFFLLCVIVAGIYGAATVSRRILLVQSVPAGVGLALVVFGG